MMEKLSLSSVPHSLYYFMVQAYTHMHITQFVSLLLHYDSQQIQNYVHAYRYRPSAEYFSTYEGENNHQKILLKQHPINIEIN
jgi:hypothetical protein